MAVPQAEPYIDPDLESDVLDRAHDLRGCRVVHINATPTGGGVAEILVSLVPQLRRWVWTRSG